MKNIQILDCTLRDGGYVNNWEFGEEAVAGVRRLVAEAGAEIIELGFFRDEPYFPHRTVFNSAQSLEAVVGQKEEGTLFAGITETANLFPLEKMRERNGGGLDVIRFSFWARVMDEAYEYAKTITEKGYKLCCQPTRVESYTLEAFGDMCRRFSTLKPYAVYIVDTFGLLRKDDLLRYAEVANANLDSDIILGYHAHDNMGQAFHNACAFLEMDLGDRRLQIDASVGGIGRGAGNLRLEMIMEYLNTVHGASYHLAPVYEAWDKYIAPIKETLGFGYDPAYFIAAAASCNPNYAQFYLQQGLACEQISRIISRIEGPDKYLYSDEKARRFMEEGAI